LMVAWRWGWRLCNPASRCAGAGSHKHPRLRWRLFFVLFV
jgi:hypothetical protein